MTQDRGILETISSYFVPIHREGHKFVAIGAGVTLILFLISNTLGWLGAILTCFVAYFFRDPDRVIPLRGGLVLSPADGKIRAIEIIAPPEELGLADEPCICISITLSIFDVHINRVPVAGKIVRSVYTPGLFLNPDFDKASRDNERRSLVLQTNSEQLIGVVQIAGIVARRIVNFVEEGASLGTGERFGLIRFGSRVDVYLPPGHNALIAVGQTVLAGETVLADLNSNEPEREARII